MEPRIKFVLIGCGRIAARHAEHISNLAELAAVCDIDRSKADLLGARYGKPAYYTMEDLLADKELEFDVASVCTPNGLHAHHAILALNAKKHVLCEKPLAITTADCGRMINAAERNNKRLFVIKQNRFNPPVEAIKKAVDANAFGKIYSVQLNCFWNRNEEYYRHSWKGTKDLDGGTLFTQFSHFVDLLYYLMGDVEEVQSYLGNYHHKGIIEFEDTGVVIFRFASGAIGTLNYTVNAYGKNMEGSITIFGEKGTAKIGGEYLNELEYANFEDYSINNLPKGNKANNYGTYVGSMSNHDKVYENVIDVLAHNKSMTTLPYEALKTVEIIEKVYKSAKG